MICILGLSQPTYAMDTGWISPTQNHAESFYGDGFEINPEYAHGDGSGFAVNTNNPSPSVESHFYYGFNFPIPEGSTITGIEVRLDWYVSSIPTDSIRYIKVILDCGLNCWTDEKSESSQFPTSEETTILGGPNDDWLDPGENWTVDGLNSTNFQVVVKCNPTPPSWYLDWIAVKVYYSSNEDSNPVGGIYTSNDRLNTLTPYLALVGLIGVVSTIFVIRRWRKN